MWIGSRLVRAQTTSFTFNTFYTQVSQHLGCLELNKKPGVCFSFSLFFGMSGGWGWKGIHFIHFRHLFWMTDLPLNVLGAYVCKGQAVAEIHPDPEHCNWGPTTNC